MSSLVLVPLTLVFICVCPVLPAPLTAMPPESVGKKGVVSELAGR